MKKGIKKLNLNKKTIANLSNAQMSRQIGGDPTVTRKDCSGNCTYGCTYLCTYSCHGATCNKKCGY